MGGYCLDPLDWMITKAEMIKEGVFAMSNFGSLEGIREVLGVGGCLFDWSESMDKVS